MGVPTWIEFIAARNGTSSAGSSSPVLEKCSNSSAKNMKRCRSLRPGGSMSVDSVLLVICIGQRAGGDAADRPTPDERLMKAASSYQHASVMETTPDSPIRHFSGACQ